MPSTTGADGEDVAREHLKGTEYTPQLKKETSQEAGAATTAGGAYARCAEWDAASEPAKRNKSSDSSRKDQT